MMYLGDQAVGLATSIPEFGDVVKIEVGKYTPSIDEETSSVSISHSLGQTLDFIIWFAEEIVIDSSWTENYLVSGEILPLNVPLLAEYSRDCVIKTACSIPGSSSSITHGRGVNLRSNYSTSSTFSLPSFPSVSQKLKSGITYRYIIGKFKEVTPNA